MNRYAKDHWIPVDISLPDSNRIVQMQIAELPDATIGSYWADRGEWVFEEKDYEELVSFTPLAWREMSDPYREEEESLLFRSADEARTLTFNVLQRMKRGNPDREFYDTREQILHATMQGKFELYFNTMSQEILEALSSAGYEIIKEDYGYTISWK